MTKRRPILNLFRRFARAKGGATAVEFALVAGPFFILLFAVFELGMVMLVSTSLDQALGQAARTVRTGQVVSSTGGTVAALKTTLCNQLSWLGSTCTSKVMIDVRSFSSFSAVAANPPTSPSTSNPNPALTWDTGGPCSVVLVTAWYPWTLYAPVMNVALKNYTNNQRLLTSSAVFRNEPYNPGATNSQC